MHYVEEYLRLKKEVEFGDSQETANNIDVTVLADIIYTKVMWVYIFQKIISGFQMYSFREISPDYVKY